MDTIFGIDPDLKIRPRFVFRQNNYTVEDQVPGQPERLPASLVVLTFREMEDYFFIMGLKGNRGQNFMYSKIDRTIWRIKGFGIPNDIDGGPDINPDRTTEDFIYCEEHPWVFLNPPADSVRTVLPCKYPEKQETYRKFLSTVTEEDNPVVMIVRLNHS